MTTTKLINSPVDYESFILVIRLINVFNEPCENWGFMDVNECFEDRSFDALFGIHDSQLVPPGYWFYCYTKDSKLWSNVDFVVKGAGFFASYGGGDATEYFFAIRIRE